MNDPTTPSASVTKPPFKGVDPDSIKMKMKLDYGRANKDAGVRALDYIMQLIPDLTRPEVHIADMIQDATRIIYRQLHVKEVAIGLRSNLDGLYRYIAMQGMRQDVWAGHKDLSYALEDFRDFKKWKGTQISKLTILFLAEDAPYAKGEEDTYHQHLMQSSKRLTTDDSIEGDYLDIHMLGANDELVGWIEISGTWEGKLPDAVTIHWLELLASILGAAISLKTPPSNANGRWFTQKKM